MNVKARKAKGKLIISGQLMSEELSRGAFEFSNISEGFENAKAWVLALAAKNDK